MAVESTTLMSDAAKYLYDSTKASQSSAASSNTLTTDDYWKLMASYSTGLLGKEVTVAIPDPNGEKDEDGKTKVTYKKGTVTGVDLTGATSVYVDGKKYELSQVMSVGEVPEAPEKE